MTITRTLAIALGIAAMAAPAAQARPVEDIHTPLIQNEQAKPQVLPDHAGWYPHAPGHPSEAARPVDAPAAPAERADGGNGIDWLTIGLGVAGSLLAVSGIAALNARRTRVAH
jgi:hypothetical protein